jgi:protein gp37
VSTAIEWTDETWNPVVGCTKASGGCDHCYAKTLHDKRHKAALAGKAVHPQYLQPFETVQLMPERLEAPLHWRKPRRCFVNSVSDLFHEDVPDEFLDRVFAVMALAPIHTFQVLTKRPQRMLDYLRTDDLRSRIAAQANAMMRGSDSTRGFDHALSHRFLWREIENAVVGEWANRLSGIAEDQWPLPNVWLGVSVENQACAKYRIPLLLDTPATVRFLSCEPLLGPIDLTRLELVPDSPRRSGIRLNALTSTHVESCLLRTDRGIDWVIVGGESGPEARPCDVAWIESIAAQCWEVGVPLFVKQLGKWIAGDHTGFSVDRWLFSDGTVFVPPIIGDRAFARPVAAVAFSLGDAKGGNPARWPERLRVRQFPGDEVPA